MAGRTPEQALDTHVERLRIALSCITTATVFGSAASLGNLHSLTLYAPGQDQVNRISLTTHGGIDELILRIVQRYSVVFQPNVVQREPYDVWTSYYQYRILDRDEGEIVVYHWEPQGRSPVVVPHLHMPAATPVILPQPIGSPLTNTKTHLAKLHLPTGRIGIEDIVELLLNDFNVDPLITDWNGVLQGARSSGVRS